MTKADLALAASDNRRLSIAAAVAAVGFHLLGAGLIAVFAPFPTTFDEIQHLSYIRWMEHHPAVFPRYELMPTLSPDGRSWTSVGNYLTHPSPYYLAMGLADRAAGGAIPALRLTDIVISLLALGLMLAAGFAVLRGWRERAVFASALVLFPKLGVIAGLINNDNGALLAVGVAFAALIAWQSKPGPREAAWLAAGLALCGWAKATDLIMQVFAVATAEALRRVSGDGRRPAPGSYLLVMAGVLAGTAPNLVNFVRYHRPFFHSNFFFVPVSQRAHLDFAGYAQLFLSQMVSKWAAAEPASPLAVAGLALVLALSAAACIIGWRVVRSGRPDEAAWRAALGLMIAAIPSLMAHLLFGWGAVVEDGYLFAAQARYYYALWPGFALGLALLWRAAEGLPLRFAITSITAALLVTSSAGFFVLGLLSKGALVKP